MSAACTGRSPARRSATTPAEALNCRKLTTSGALARHLELPGTGWTRRYRVRVFGAPTPQTLEKLAKGVTIDGVAYGAVQAAVDESQSTKGGASNTWLTISLKEGKNREVRKLFEHFGHPVSRLIRVAYGPFQLGNLPSGEVKEMPKKVWGTFVPTELRK